MQQEKQLRQETPELRVLAKQFPCCTSTKVQILRRVGSWQEGKAELLQHEKLLQEEIHELRAMIGAKREGEHAAVLTIVQDKDSQVAALREQARAAGTQFTCVSSTEQYSTKSTKVQIPTQQSSRRPLGAGARAHSKLQKEVRLCSVY
jgi:hypothetical protein